MKITWKRNFLFKKGETVSSYLDCYELNVYHRQCYETDKNNMNRLDARFGITMTGNSYHCYNLSVYQLQYCDANTSNLFRVSIRLRLETNISFFLHYVLNWTKCNVEKSAMFFCIGFIARSSIKEKKTKQNRKTKKIQWKTKSYIRPACLNTSHY